MKRFFYTNTLFFFLSTALIHATDVAFDEKDSPSSRPIIIPTATSTLTFPHKSESIVISNEQYGVVMPEYIKEASSLRELIVHDTRIGGLENLNASASIEKIIFSGESTLPKITFLSKEDLPPALKILILMDNKMNEFHLRSAPQNLYVLSLENVFDALSVPDHTSVLGAVMNGQVFQEDFDWQRIASIANVTIKDDAWKDDLMASSLTFQNPSTYLQNFGITPNTSFDFFNGEIQINELEDGYSAKPIIDLIQHARLSAPLLPL